jgi:hypothetical protein
VQRVLVFRHQSWGEVESELGEGDSNRQCAESGRERETRCGLRRHGA